ANISAPTAKPTSAGVLNKSWMPSGPKFSVAAAFVGSSSGFGVSRRVYPAGTSPAARLNRKSSRVDALELFQSP
ncbi:MAG: hypothetical protein WCL32_16925, partial [Planctomycetota bacterium]